jgi:hypothetical protein
LGRVSKSIPFIIFTSCIEALTDIEFEKENKSIKYSCDCKTVDDSLFKCKKCNKPIWGMSYKFKEILRRFAEDSVNSNRFYNKWYTVRSKIVHYEKLLLADTGVSWDDGEKLTEQSVSLYKVRLVTRIVIVNWMLNSTMAK